MPEPLVVHLNRDELYDVEPAVETYEAAGSFPVELHNHGQAVHVHLRLDDALSRVAEVESPNRFVDTDATETVRIRVAETDPPTTGSLKLVSGYGSGTDFVQVDVGPEDRGSPDVAVDERLAEPSGDGGDGAAGLLTAPVTAVVVALAVLALALAATAGLVAQSLTVALGIVAVLIGVAAAGYLLVS